MRKKPDYCRLECPYHKIGSGFVPDEFPETAKIGVLLEAPGKSEIDFDSYGRPLVGKTWYFVKYNILEPLGIKREDLFLANTIRCNPPGNNYPIGKMAQEAREKCRHWDDKLNSFGEDLYIVTWHPAAIFRTPPLVKFVMRSFQLAQQRVAEGRRPLLLCGDKAVSLKMPWLKGGVKRWQRSEWEVASVKTT